MRNYIILNGQNSNEISGLIIQKLPPITKPLIRTQVEEIDGRDGDIVTKLGFSAYTKEFTIGLYGNYDVNQIIAYFNSEGTVTFSNEPDKFYNYQILEEIDFEKLIRFKTATVKMHCQPFKYSTNETPLITEGSNLMTFDDFTLTKNGVTVTASDGGITVNGTATAATEVYMPINTLSLEAGDYIFQAYADGTNPEACSLRVIYNSPSTANSFGGKYVTLQNESVVSLTSTISTTTTYNYLYFYITAGTAMNFNLGLELINANTSHVSGEGNEIVLDRTGASQFTKLILKGDTYQPSYRGINLFNTQSIGSIYNTEVVSLTNNEVVVKPTTAYSSTDHYIEYNNIVVEGSTKYTLSAKQIITGANNTASNRGLIRVTAQKSGGGTRTLADLYSTSSSGKVTFTTTSDTVSLIISFSSLLGADDNWENIEITYSDIQIEKGATATDFEPYTGGKPAPSPDYSVDVKTVTREQNIRIAGGHNLFSTAFCEDFEANDNNTFTLDKPSQPNANFIFPEALPVGTYTLSLEYSNNGLLNDVWNVKAYDELNRVVVFESGIGTSITITPYSTIKRLYFYIDDSEPNGATTTFTHVQLEAGSTATDYVPYRAQDYKINLGKNLLNPEAYASGVTLYTPTVGTTITNTLSENVTSTFANDTISVSTTSTNGGALYLSPQLAPGTYHISTNITAGTNNNAKIRANILDSNHVVLRNDDYFTIQTGSSRDIGFNITLASGEVYIAITLVIPTTGGGTLTATNPQLELGSTATTFYPFINPIELCKIGDYQDYIYKSGDDWYVHKETNKHTFTGSENWFLQISGTPSILYCGSSILSDAVNSAVQTRIYSDYFHYATTAEVGRCYLYNRSVFVFYGDTSTTASTLKTWLGNNNTTVYYPLATPTETKITATPLIDQLNALSNAHAYSGRTIITATALGDDLPYIVEAEALTSSDSVITNSGNTTAKPTLTIYGSGDIGVILNGIQIFNISLGENEYITIDANAMEAYKDTPATLMNRLVVGDYNNFVLQPGENLLEFSGSVEKAVITNYNRWI